MQDAMLEALKRRRGKGMELTIMMGGHPSEEDIEQNEKPSDDMAPEMKMQSPKGESPHVEVELEDPKRHALEVARGEEDDTEFSRDPEQGESDMDDEMISGMSDSDKQRALLGKPRSLMERAKQAALMRKK